MLDAFSQRVVGWCMANHLRAELILDALEMSLWQRRPRMSVTPTNGTQYTSLAFGKRCREAGITPSMGSVGDCCDNAMAESFFATLECELLDRYGSGITPKPAWPCLSLSNAGTTLNGGIRRSTIIHQFAYE